MPLPPKSELERYDMYHAFGTREKAQAKKRSSTPPPSAFKPAKYTVKRATPPAAQRPKKQQDTGNQAIFHRQPPKRPDGTPSPLSPSAPGQRRGPGGYVQVMGTEHALRPVRMPTLQIVTKRDKVKKPFPTAIVFGSLICTVLLLFFIYNFMEYSRYTSVVNDLGRKLTVLKQEQSELELQIVQRDDLVKVEYDAVEKHGMMKAESQNKKYVTVVNSDKTVVVSDKQTDTHRRDVVELQ